jgi:hypothetical protein
MKSVQQIGTDVFSEREQFSRSLFSTNLAATGVERLWSC